MYGYSHAPHAAGHQLGRSSARSAPGGERTTGARQASGRNSRWPAAFPAWTAGGRPERPPSPPSCRIARPSSSRYGRLVSPLGLHRVIEPAGVLPQAAWRLDARPEIWPDEVRVAVRAAESRRRLVPAAAARPATVTRRPSGPRWRTSWPAGARCRTRSPARAACSSAWSRRSARSPALGLRSGRPCRHAGLAQPDPAGHHRRAGSLGRPVGAGALRGPRDPVRPVHRRRASR